MVTTRRDRLDARYGQLRTRLAVLEKQLFRLLRLTSAQSVEVGVSQLDACDLIAEIERIDEELVEIERALPPTDA